MRTFLVVLDAVRFGQHLRLQQAAEDFPVEELIPQLVMEAFDVPILPWAAGSDVKSLHSLVPQPVLDGVGDEQGIPFCGNQAAFPRPI